MKVRELRLAKKWTIEQLAMECDFDTTQISKVELGRVDPTSSRLKRIADALGVHISMLYP